MQEMTLEVNSLLGQKQEASLLDVHLGARLSQVLMHCGTVLGHGEEGAGLDAGDVPVEIPEVAADTAAVWVAVAEHLVQMVETEVRVTVEIVLEVVT
jgi:hypothetical protein